MKLLARTSTRTEVVVTYEFEAFHDTEVTVVVYDTAGEAVLAARRHREQCGLSDPGHCRAVEYRKEVVTRSSSSTIG